jgi:hypothetical protein
MPVTATPEPPKNPLENERLDSLVKKWESQINRNEHDYKKQAQELLEAETFIFRAISQVKAIE